MKPRPKPQEITLTPKQREAFEDMKRFMAENQARIEWECQQNVQARVRMNYLQLNQKQDE